MSFTEASGTPFALRCLSASFGPSDFQLAIRLFMYIGGHAGPAPGTASVTSKSVSPSTTPTRWPLKTASFILPPSFHTT